MRFRDYQMDCERLRLAFFHCGTWRDCQLAPELAYGRHAGPPGPTARLSAVAVLLFPEKDCWYTVLTIRPDDLPVHGGQISFPGGSLQPAEAPEAGALREWNEELGPLPVRPDFLGRFPELYVFHSDYRIIPCIFATTFRPECVPHPTEVSEVLQLPVGALADPQRRGWHWQMRGALRFAAPHIAWQGKRIWGATAMICELLVRLFYAAGIG